MERSLGVADAVDSTSLRLVFEISGRELQVLLHGDLSVPLAGTR